MYGRYFWWVTKEMESFDQHPKTLENKARFVW